MDYFIVLLQRLLENTKKRVVSPLSMPRLSAAL
jgi:hypothetical protein